MSAGQWYLLAAVLVLLGVWVVPKMRRAWNTFWKDFQRIYNHGEDEIDGVAP